MTAREIVEEAARALEDKGCCCRDDEHARVAIRAALPGIASYFAEHYHVIVWDEAERLAAELREVES